MTLVSVIDCLFTVHQLYGQIWSFLWVAKWKIILLAAVFFVGVWAAMLDALQQDTRVAVFAVGFGAPRWCQVCSILVYQLSRCIEVNGTDVVE